MLTVIQGALEAGFLYAPIALALFLSFSILNIADMTTDGAFVLGGAVSAVCCIAGHPILALPAAMLATAAAGFITAFLQTKLGVPSILAGIITNIGLYSINLMVMGTSNLSLFQKDSIYTLAKASGFAGSWSKLAVTAIVVVLICVLLVLFLGTRLGLSIRATGDNTDMVRASSINPTFTITVGLCIANAMTGLSGAMAAQYNTFSEINGGTGMVVLALAALPFIFSLLYALAHPTPLKAAQSKAVSADPMAPVLVLAALDALYLIFLSVQSAGLFGGAEYLASQGLSYAQWARSGFFQMTGVTVVNLTVLLAALAVSRKGGRLWTALRALGALLILESFLLLASAAWRMGLYIGAYGLSFKRFLTGWGMVMMALFFLCALWKLHRPERYFLRRAVPIALCGWLVLNCIPVDHLVAKDQVDRYLDGESTTLSVYYLSNALSYDTLSQLERLDQSAPAWAYEVDDLYAPSGETLADVIAQRRAAAQADCSDWRSWSLSAYLAGGGA